MLAGAPQDPVLPSFRLRRVDSEKVRRDALEAHLLDVGLRIHIEHRLLVDPAFEFAQGEPFVGPLDHERLAGDPDGLVHRKIVQIVLEHAQSELPDLRVGRIYLDQIDRIVADGPVSQAVLHAIDVARIENQLVASDHAAVAVPPIHEFVAERRSHLRLDPRQIADRMQVVLAGIGLLHGQRIRVVETQRFGDDQVHLCEGAFDVRLGSQVGILDDCLGEGAGVIGVHVDRTALKRLEQDTGASHPEFAPHRNVGFGFDLLGGDFPQYVAFREDLRTDHDVGAASRRERRHGGDECEDRE